MERSSLKSENMENTGKILFRDDSPQWYVAVGKKGVGPMTTAELYEKINRGLLTWVDFGWKKGQKSWERLCDLDDLKSLMPSRPGQDIQRRVQKSVDSEAAESPAVRPSSRASRKSTDSSPAQASQPSAPPTSPAAEAKAWYLHANATQYGPFTEKEVLRALEIGKINSRVHAWSSGMSGWERLERISIFQTHTAPSAKSGSTAASKVGSSSAGSPRVEKSTQVSDKRETPRLPMIAQVLMADEQTVIVGICRDISIGGLQVLTDRAPAPVGSRLKMNISPSGDGSGKGFQPFVAEGVVVRVLEDGRGFSFRFNRLADAARRSIEEYIESAE